MFKVRDGEGKSSHACFFPFSHQCLFFEPGFCLPRLRTIFTLSSRLVFSPEVLYAHESPAARGACSRTASPRRNNGDRRPFGISGRKSNRRPEESPPWMRGLQSLHPLILTEAFMGRGPIEKHKTGRFNISSFMGFAADLVQRRPDIGVTVLDAASGDSHGNALAGDVSGF